MTIADPLILPADVLLVPVSELSSEVRRQFTANDSDFAVTRPQSRAPSRIIDSDSAELLREFRSASTIVNAVVTFCRRRNLDAEQTLEEAFPVLQQLLNAQILVPADSEKANRIIPRFSAGQMIAEYSVVRCLQALEDTELYEADAPDGRHVALKLMRTRENTECVCNLDHEALILKHLDGTVSPGLLAADVVDGQPYLVMEWCDGLTSSEAAEVLRRSKTSNDSQRLLNLLCRIAEAYEALHRQHVIHSDVHPRNILVDDTESVRIIDFGLSRLDDMAAENLTPTRGGVGFFFEPEFARARQFRQAPPESTTSGEQYSVAALLYLLYSGRHYLEFSAEKGELMRQIAEDPPLPVVHHGTVWPELERILVRALQKQPAARFASMTELARELRGVAASPLQPVIPETLSRDRFVRNTLERIGFSGPLIENVLPCAPTNSINYGAAGIAYAMYRVSMLRADAQLLSLADVWANKAARDLTHERSFYSAVLEITPETAGRTALYHSASGVHAVQALISHAMNDMVSHQNALDAFVAFSESPSNNPDLTLGRAGTLLGCSLLLDATPQRKYLHNGRLHSLGHQIMQEICDLLSHYPAIRECQNLRVLGVAHGWAGLLYAAMLWCESTQSPIPGIVAERLKQLSECGEQHGRGMQWPIRLNSAGRTGASEALSGWCNGSAGYVFLWTLAHRTLKQTQFLKFAEMAAEDAWRDGQEFDSLCCGLAGRAYALLNIYRHSGDKRWLDRAEILTGRAVTSTQNSQLPDSLYKGSMGVCLLAAEIDRPEMARMPVFEREGW